MTGSIHEKNGKIYVLVNIKDDNGKRKVKWVSTGLDVGAPNLLIQKAYKEVLAGYDPNESKKEARERRERLKPAESKKELEKTSNATKRRAKEAQMTLPNYLYWYIEQNRNKIQHSTQAHYRQMTDYRVAPKFRNVKLCDLTAKMLSDFYGEMLDEGLSPNTVLRYNAMISGAIRYAYKHDIIEKNIMDKVDKPSAERYTGAQFYSPEELSALLDACKDDPLYSLILVTVCYGLRRSEVLGLKWDAIDEKNGKLYVKHKISVVKDYGKVHIEGSDKMKTQKSRRELPLLPEVIEALEMERQKQVFNKKIYGDKYSSEDSEYIFRDATGKLIRPDYVSRHFELILKNNNLRKIRFHDLRHSCASMLILKGQSIKEVQEWLGHSNMSTTADIYSHLCFEQKVECGNSIMEALNLA